MTRKNELKVAISRIEKNKLFSVSKFQNILFKEMAFFSTQKQLRLIRYYSTSNSTNNRIENKVFIDVS